MGVFLLPVLAMVIINTIIFVLVLRVLLKTICRKLKDQTEKQKIYKISKALICIVSIMVRFGIQWIFGTFTVAEATIVFQWLFVLVSSLQGIILFVFLVLMGSDTRKEWITVMHCLRVNGVQLSQYIISTKKTKTDTLSSKSHSFAPTSTTLSTTNETVRKSGNKESSGRDSFLACNSTSVSEAGANE